MLRIIISSLPPPYITSRGCPAPPRTRWTMWAVEAAARQRDVDIETSLHLVIGVHVRRTDFHQFSKYRMEELLHQTFYLEAVIYFLVVSESDDQDIQDIFALRCVFVA